MLRIYFLLYLLFSNYFIFGQRLAYKVGLAKTDITCYKKNAGMLGYGMYFNVVEGVQTPLYARSFVIEDSLLRQFVLVECELCFIPSELKTGVLNVLHQKGLYSSITDENLMLMAQHTHSAPGGYCHYASYNMPVPGYIPELYDSLCERIALSIAQAQQKLIPCNIKLSKGLFPNDWEVAFNRSLAAYNRNKDVPKFPPEQKALAVNRSMVLLQFEGPQQKPMGSINWFGVHATSISNDNKLINADNKGYAATYLETEYRQKNEAYVAAFAQGSAGDVSPKFVYNHKQPRQRGYWEGKYPDDVASAQYNGRLQYLKAKELIESNEQYILPTSSIHCALRFFDFSHILIDTQYSHSSKVQTTSPSCVGLAMLGGALMDGPGAPKLLLQLAKIATHLIKWTELASRPFRSKAASEAIRLKYAVQGKKDIVLESGAKKLLGTANIKGLIIPSFTDPTIASFKRFYRAGALSENTWSPQILPVQLVQIGSVVLVAFPFEITTTAGRRLQKSVADLYAHDGIQEVILCPYANSYAGYITTYEEYQEQMYEGGHCVFGAYSLAALQTVIKQLYERKHIPFAQQEQALIPPSFSSTELMKRSFYLRH